MIAIKQHSTTSLAFCQIHKTYGDMQFCIHMKFRLPHDSFVMNFCIHLKIRLQMCNAFSYTPENSYTAELWYTAENLYTAEHS